MKFNNVLGLIIHIADTQRVTTIKKIFISTEGTTNPHDIESAAIYRTGQDGLLINENSELFSNPSTMKGRHHITIKASLDNGNSWPEKYRLLIDEGSGNGYSSLTGVDNDHIGILYEGSQADLVFQKIPLRDIIGDLNQ